MVDTRVQFIHGLNDTLIDPADSRALASSGSPGLVKLIEVEDDHALHASVQSGALLDWVRGLLAASAPG